jgi:very-short-patch-repair endonuclease
MSHFDRAVADLGDRQHGLVTARQLVALDLSGDQQRRLVRSGRLAPVHPGVFRIGGAPVSWIQQVHAACLSLTRVNMASHRSAARIWRLDGINDRIVELVTERWGRPSPRRLVTIHESTDLVHGDGTTVDGVPVTTPIRTLLDLGAVVSPLRLEAALDSAVRLGLLDLSDLRQRFVEVARRGRRGVGPMRPLLEERTGDLRGPDSVFESRMRRVLREAGIPEPVCQFEVALGDRSVFLDLAWPDRRLAIECDSLAYHFGRRRLQWDDTRQNRLVLLGWTVLRFTWRDLVDRPGMVVAQIRAALATESPTPSSELAQDPRPER